ncbi:MAG TPA: metalloregulator ArsR/SmtB family transcription factor [Phycisphaerales bacterium]|nr:metalloregulator ArsR/SmtB family transcription factor [Phycisphaerales bacterium]
MPQELDAHTQAALRRNVKVFAALGDQTRVALLARLSTGEELSIARLAEGQPVSRQSVTKHLRVLARAGLVRTFRNGRERRFALRPEPLDRARESLERISRQWDVALHRLKSMLEQESDQPGGPSGR